MINTAANYTYDEIYMELWETAQRYFSFVNFRVIGNSHDDRMIPMIEIGNGDTALFCVSGISGNEENSVRILLKMIKEYCNLYERKWEMNELYDLRVLLNKIRVCIIPIANPDGYEIYKRGYLAIRNPVLRQMLRMQDIPHREFEGNSRNADLQEDFPLIEGYLDFKYENDYANKFIIENETRSLINIFDEYKNAGLIVFGKAGGKIVQYKYQQKFVSGKDRRIAGHLKKLAGYRLEADRFYHLNNNRGNKVKGDCGQYYARFIRKPAFRIDVPQESEDSLDDINNLSEVYETLKSIPLEFIFTI